MLGLFIWGHGSDSIDLGITDTRYCEACKREHNFKMTLNYRYAHIYWVFSWVIKKKYFFICEVCHKGWELKTKEVEKLLSKSPIPFKRRYGWMFLLFIIVWFTVFISLSVNFGPNNSTASLSTTNTHSSLPTPENASRPVSVPNYVRPTVTEKGYFFPATSGYIDGYLRQAQNGYSSVTIDNSQNKSDVFVKLYSLNATPPKSVRTIFIRAHEKFTIDSISAGNYDVRYRDLDSGALARTDSFDLQEFKNQKGIQYSAITLTLYQVSGGNMQIHKISEHEF